ncbi:MAG: GNAT family N-acetyltransferase [Candidatus Diapherotrites archaeon]|nr:GNAT family N-acetyltransferase [Candidatus Diapherotrites archaeon]
MHYSKVKSKNSKDFTNLKLLFTLGQQEKAIGSAKVPVAKKMTELINKVVQIESDDQLHLVGYEGRRAVAAVSINWNHKTLQGGVPFIYVHPDFRGHGLTSELIRTAQTYQENVTGNHYQFPSYPDEHEQKFVKVKKIRRIKKE